MGGLSMDMKDFYDFGSKLSSSTVQVHALNLTKGRNEQGLYDKHRLIMGDYLGISFPVVFQQEYGKKLLDMLDTGWPSLYLISERMKSALEENSLKGWKIFS